MTRIRTPCLRKAKGQCVTRVRAPFVASVWFLRLKNVGAQCERRAEAQCVARVGAPCVRRVEDPCVRGGRGSVCEQASGSEREELQDQGLGFVWEDGWGSLCEQRGQPVTRLKVTV